MGAETGIILLEVSIAFIAKWVILSNLFLSRITLRIESLELKHGPQTNAPLDCRILLGVLLGPFFEELIFRFPILKMYEGGTSLPIFIVLAILINLLWVSIHILNTTKFTDGHEEQISISALLNITAAAFFYTILVLVTKSIWPPILLHSLWNLSVLFEQPTKFMVKTTKFTH
ncbi:MAG: hypothetical protein A3J47_02325 [Candidatus Yanofskybacteria bacterium RIFCSPHIGHO2_02_FULL_43_22]|uniref:CAAX prenyl protease 2/Lysostaphin resistance protein A-like domain-containing protein n=1 Tax=Candidatus Yanofskybacteria bacterium RIFCSPHIGHO2_02_FULL_43_22 TaxID=1802681 RepID=A0A1F8FN10_9BACT|nr:MAG: hypothetical protein A3J47_02325 [Candidatus Yanofskybacteria bacterium RIFCSPHIGHO2_02_FULL_43_22]